MVGRSWFAAQPALLWKFLGFFQSPALRRLHALIVVLVVLQLCSSAWFRVFGWYHMVAGMSLCLLGLVQTGYSLRVHGLRYFFPYLFGDLAQIKRDVVASLRFKLIAPRPGGLAAAVQGLGLGALLLTAFSGLLSFVLWRTGSPYGHDAMELHKGISMLIVWYLIGHGGMALAHFIYWQRTTARPTQSAEPPA